MNWSVPRELMAEPGGQAIRNPAASEPASHAAEHKAQVAPCDSSLTRNILFLDTSHVKNSQFPTPQFWASHQISRKFHEEHPSLHVASQEDSPIVLVHSPDPSLLAEVSSFFEELAASMNRPPTRRVRYFLNRIGMISRDHLHALLSDFGSVVFLGL